MRKHTGNPLPSPRSDQRCERGAALVLVLFVLTVLTVLGVMVLNTAMVELKMAANQRTSAQVFYAAEAGLERGLKSLIEDFEYEIDHDATPSWDNSWHAAATITQTAVSGGATFDEAVRSMDMYLNSPSVRLLSFPGGQTVGNCTYSLYLYTVSPNEAYLMSYATGLGGVGAVEYHLRVEDLSPYNNAIFSGAGITGAFNGNVNVGGSIYVRGNVSPGGDVKFANNYDDFGGMDATAKGLLPTIDNLESRIRIKGGDFTLSGNAQVGEAGTNGSYTGVYVDGFTNINDDDHKDTNYPGIVSNRVPDVPMPTMLDGLKEEYGDAFIAGCGYTGSDAAVALSIYADLAAGTGCFAGDPTTGVVISGNIVLDKDSNTAWAYSDGNGNGLFWDPATDTLKVQGNVTITGNLSVGDPPLLGKVNYEAVGADTGTGSDPEAGAILTVGGSVNVDGTFAPKTTSGYLKGGSDTNSLGVVAAGSITFDGGPSSYWMGFFYSQTQVNFNYQATMAGTIISNVVNWGQVPWVYQVPALREYRPKGMPGGYSVMSFTTREWRRVY